MPEDHQLPDRLAAVLVIVYLVFNQGWGDGRVDLAAEIRLGRALVELIPDESETLGLLALMLLNDARRDAPVRESVLVPLDEQDRSLWDERQVLEGRELLGQAVARRSAGTYVIQAAIADPHLQQPRDWYQIAALYGTLARRTGSAVVELNRAVAIAELDGPEAGLAFLSTLSVDDYRYYHSTRAELLRRAGRTGDSYRTVPGVPRCMPRRDSLAGREIRFRVGWEFVSREEAGHRTGPYAPVRFSAIMGA